LNQVIHPEEAVRFLKAAAGDAHGMLFTFALATGMRPEEYLALNGQMLIYKRAQ